MMIIVYHIIVDLRSSIVAAAHGWMSSKNAWKLLQSWNFSFLYRVLIFDQCLFIFVGWQREFLWGCLACWQFTSSPRPCPRFSRLRGHTQTGRSGWRDRRMDFSHRKKKKNQITKKKKKLIFFLFHHIGRRLSCWTMATELRKVDYLPRSRNF